MHQKFWNEILASIDFSREEVLGFIAFLIAMLTAARLTLAVFEPLYEKFVAWKRRKNIKGLLIQPTVEEKSKYSIKNFSKNERLHRDDAAAKAEELLAKFMRILSQQNKMIRIVCLAFVLAYFWIGLSLAIKMDVI